MIITWLGISSTDIFMLDREPGQDGILIFTVFHYQKEEGMI